MTSAFETLLSRRGWLLADGATGTTLFDMGLMSGDAQSSLETIFTLTELLSSI